MQEREEVRRARRPGSAIRERLTYANVTATLALFVALGGGSFAIAALSGSEKKQVRQIAKKQANQVLNQRETTLNVNSAKTADSATNASTADTLDGQDATAFLGSSIVSRTASDALGTAQDDIAQVNVACAPGEMLIGGGAQFTAFDRTASLMASRPRPGIDGATFNEWRAEAVRTANSAQANNLRVFAICAS